jgi:choline transport protein
MGTYCRGHVSGLLEHRKLCSLRRLHLAGFTVTLHVLCRRHSCMLRARLVDGVQQSSWSLGVYGAPINIFALMYTGWMMVIFCFPQYLPVTGDNFNYALPIFAFVILIAIVLWFARARKNWPGLDREIIDTVMADADKNTKD